VIRGIFYNGNYLNLFKSVLKDNYQQENPKQTQVLFGDDPRGVEGVVGVEGGVMLDESS
jgi:hypothetical protein